MKHLFYLCIVVATVLSLVRFGVCFVYLQDLKLKYQLDHSTNNTKKSISTPQLLSYQDKNNAEKIEEKIDKKIEEKIEEKIDKDNTYFSNNKKVYVAIILDDCGYLFNERVRKFIQGGYKVNLSIIPATPFCRDIAKLAKANGLDVMLHMPMEPFGPNPNLYKYKLTLNMTEEEIESTTAGALASIGEPVVAVNNHMGSKVTQDRGVMYPFLLTLAKYDLFYVDSITTPKSVVYKISKLVNIPVLKRDIFLDNIAQVQYTKRQLQLLVTQAKKKGYAIGLGHVKETTIKAIEEMYPHLKNSGVEFVSISYLLNNVIKKS